MTKKKDAVERPLEWYRKKYHEEGHTMEEIRAITGEAITTIARRLDATETHRRGRKPRPYKRGKIDPTHLPRIVRELAEIAAARKANTKPPITVAEIAVRENVSRETIYRIERGDTYRYVRPETTRGAA